MTELSQEHHKLNEDGSLDGLYVVDTDKVKFNGGDFWTGIDSIIKDYTTIHPNEMRVHLYEVQQIKRKARNEFASTKNKSLRFGASIPPGLFFSLNKVAPDLFNNKKLFRAFLKRYRGFAIPEKI